MRASSFGPARSGRKGSIMRKSSRVSSRVVILLSLAAAGSGLVGCGDKEAKQAPAAGRPVATMLVRYQPVAPERSFVAAIRPRVESDLGFRVPGKVAKRLVDTGKMVKAGDALATLDETDLRHQSEQAAAELRAATSTLTQTTGDEQRQADLRRKGFVADAVYERTRAAMEEARSRKARAEHGVELARNALDYAVLKADADGVVTATMIEPGQVVAAGQPAVRLAHTREKEALVAIPEAQIDRVAGAMAWLVLWSKPSKGYRATLRELSPSADAATRTYAARFTLADVDSDLQLGMTGTLTLADGQGMRVAKLPLSAVFNQGTGAALWVVDANGALRLAPVEIAAYESDSVLIRGGVEEGARVVTLGVQKLDAGQRVRIVEQRS